MGETPPYSRKEVNVENYHKHDHWSNVYTPDSTCTYEDYAKRAVELGHKTLSCVAHGFQGNYYKCAEVAEEYGLKFVFGTEAYWVKDRKEKDRSNGHIILLARNENGRRAINRILSEAAMTGYYYKPRVDVELLLSLPAKDVMVTTACLTFWKHYDDIEDIMLKLYNHFGENFYLEVQHHLSEKQIATNKHVLAMHEKHGIKMILGLDSHYITKEQQEDRSLYLEAKGIRYEDEEGWLLTYPSDSEVFKIMQAQGILNDKQIQEVMSASDEILNFDDISFDKEIKLPSVHQELSQVERDKLLGQIAYDEWLKYSTVVSDDAKQEYIDEIKKELKDIFVTGMSDYFLLDYAIVKKAKEIGGLITKTGRGSGVSYFTNTLLGFSNVDRINSKVHLYPERFMSATRILETKSLPDLDLNLANPEKFIEAQDIVMGEGHSYPLVAWRQFRVKSAWKMFAKANNVPFEVANAVTEQISKYEDAMKYAEDDEKDTIDIYDYISPEHIEIFEGSRKYRKMIDGKVGHPCGHLIYQGDIISEIGLMKCKSESTGKEVITTVIDGSVVEDYKFLKNDLLKVDVWNLIYKIFDRVGVEPLSIKELEDKTTGNQKVWDIYSKGFTLGINQCESVSTTGKVMRYKPTNVSELCAFVAGIRPSFKSMYDTFEKRERFSYGIPAFDKIIQTEEMPDSFLLYQEQIMAAMNYGGIPMSECYGIIKGISKKKAGTVNKAKEQFLKGFTEKIMEDEGRTYEEAMEISLRVWTIIEDAAGYGFNASHSLSYAYDSLYCAYLKALYPLEFYEVLMNEYSEKGKKDKVALLKQEMMRYGINIGDIKYGLDNRGFVIDKANNAINTSILSLKFMNKKTAQELWMMSKKQKFDNFVDVLIYLLERTSLDSRKITILIKIGYFEQFGKSKTLLGLYEYFENRYKKTHVDKTKIVRRQEVLDYFEKMDNIDFTINEKVTIEIETFGFIKTHFNLSQNIAVVSELNRKYSNPTMTLIRLCDGQPLRVKVKARVEAENPLAEVDIIRTNEIKMEGKWKMSPSKITEKNKGGWYQDEEDKEPILKSYTKLTFE